MRRYPFDDFLAWGAGVRGHQGCVLGVVGGVLMGMLTLLFSKAKNAIACKGNCNHYTQTD